MMVVRDYANAHLVISSVSVFSSNIFDTIIARPICTPVHDSLLKMSLPENLGLPLLNTICFASMTTFVNMMLLLQLLLLSLLLSHKLDLATRHGEAWHHVRALEYR